MKGKPDYEQMSAFDQVREGLKDSLAHAKRELTLRTTTLPSRAPLLSKTRVASIRKKMGMSQAVFARFLNVPTKTLQSWEQGARTPKAGEARLLQIAAAHPDRFEALVVEATAVQTGQSRRTRSRSRVRSR